MTPWYCPEPSFTTCEYQLLIVCSSVPYWEEAASPKLHLPPHPPAGGGGFEQV